MFVVLLLPSHSLPSPSHTTIPFSLSFFIPHNHNRHEERKIPDAILKHLCGVSEWEWVRHKVNGYKENEKAFFFFIFLLPLSNVVAATYSLFVGVINVVGFRKKESKFMYRIHLTLEEFLLLLPCSPFWLFFFSFSSSYFISQG